MYLPDSYARGTADRFRVLVLIHGSDRRPQQLRDEFAAFCEAQKCVALAPLFPAEIERPQHLDGYKYLDTSAARYDLVLLQMLNEIRTRYGVPVEQILLFGFSGGAHFAHRFLLHPERLTAVSIAAPGAVTLLDDRRDWPAGIRNVEQLFGVTVDPAKLANVQIQLVIGSMDTNTAGIAISREHPVWIEGV